jgi:hypothetical protein
VNPVMAALQAAKLAELQAQELKRLGLLGPPRGWDGKHKAMWFALPPELKTYTTAREDERDAALKRAFNKVAEMKRKLHVEAITAASGTAGTAAGADTVPAA